MAVDMFLKITDIKGESFDEKHKDEIHIESISWGGTQQGTHGVGGGGGAGKVSMNDIHITKFVDKSSADLMYAMCSGKHLKEAVITFRKAGEQPLEYLKITLTDVLVSSQQYAGGGGGDRTVENLSLNFAVFKQEYFMQNSKGAGEAAGAIGWDVKQNKKV
jgi:type VI secretion system secreted protein Hcp